MKKLLVFLCASLMFFSIVREASCDIFYAIGRTVDYENSILFRVNSVTAEVTYINEVRGKVTGLAYSPGGTLYAYDTADTYPDVLLTIDPSTGNSMFETTVTGWQGEGVGIAFGQYGTLYASNGGDLVTINPTSGTANVIGNRLGNDYDVDGLDFSSSGILYGMNGAGPSSDRWALYTINLSTGIETPGIFTGRNMQPIAFDPNDVLFSIDNGSQADRGDEYLVIVDPITGSVTNIGGPIRAGFYTALVYGGPNPTSIPINIDIKPNSCPNAVNIDPKGILTVAILGTADLDVTTIDPLSVSLEGVDPIRSSIKDVATPVSNPQSYCECNSEWEDGYDDLVLKFKASDVVDVLGEVQHGDEVVLTLSGLLSGETPIEGYDCIVFVSKGKGK